MEVQEDDMVYIGPDGNTYASNRLPPLGFMYANKAAWSIIRGFAANAEATQPLHTAPATVRYRHPTTTTVVKKP